MKSWFNLRGGLSLLLIAAVSCDAPDRSFAPLKRIASRTANAVDFSSAAIQVRVGAFGEFIPFRYWDPAFEPPPDCHYTVNGVELSCDEVVEVGPGSHDVKVYWYRELIAEETVATSVGETTIRQFDLGARASQLTGRILVNGEVDPPRSACAGFEAGFVCGATDAEGRFRLIVKSGTGVLNVMGKEFPYDVAAGAVADLGDIAIQVAGVRLQVMIGKEVVSPQTPGMHYCRVDMHVSTSPAMSIPCTTNGVFTGAPAEYKAALWWAGSHVESRQVTLTNGTNVVHTVDLGAVVGLISGRLVINGESAAQQRWCMRGPTGLLMVCGESAADGSISAVMPAGPATIELNRNHKLVFEQQVKVLAGQRTDVGDVAVSLGGVRVRYTYLGEPLPPSQCSVWATQVSTGIGQPLSPCGSLHALPPGDYRIIASVIGGNLRDEIVALPAGSTVDLTYDVGGVYGKVTGQATYNGSPLPKDRPVCAWADSYDVCVMPAANGQFTFWLPPGQGTLRFYGKFEAISSAPFTVVAGQTVQVGEPAPGETPPGSNVPVQPIDETTGEPSPVDLTFANVTSRGQTTVTSAQVGHGGGPRAPSNFRLGSPPTYYDIETTATFSGAIRLCISYAGVRVGNERQLKLLHHEGNSWVDVTLPGYPDIEKDIVCGEVTSLSPFLVAEQNAAPTISSITLPGAPAALGVETSLTAMFSDLNTGDSHTATIAWGDGTTSQATVNAANGVGSITASHMYSDAGVYVVQVSVSDGDLTATRSSANDAPSYVVVYDPAAGFVTGGGWIDSPAGAYAADASLIGKATFGFVARYQRGASVPSGTSEFQFKAGGLSFKSTSYEWLVVSRSRARFKGVGSINGLGDYAFMVTAVDDGSSDRFRIKIWNRATDQVIYDNQMGSTDEIDAATALGGGSIVVHSK